MTPQQLVDALRAFKKAHGMSLEDLAKFAKVKKKTLEPWLREGSSHYLPSVSNVIKISDLLEREHRDYAPGNPNLFDNIPTLDESTNSDEDGTMTSHSQSGAVKSTIGHTPKITGSVFQNLLAIYKTVTDPIHDDIRLTKLEIDIMDTRDFQRLKGFRQLASAHLVYPSAVHTRFEHAIGTLAQAQAMVASINANPQTQNEVKDEARLLIRLAALLHDIPYVPFGHEMEDEARLVAKHETRYEEFLGPGTKIGSIIGERLDGDFLKLLLKTLSARGEQQTDALVYPFAADIVGNTVCADLLDYLKRDNYFTGLKENFGKRFMDYFVVSEIPSGSLRLVVLLEKKGALRRDVLSEIVHLLRARYTLGERVYFHHTKQVASAMVTKAVYLAGLRDHPRLRWFSDDELLRMLEDAGDEGASRIVSGLRARDLYKTVYRVGEYHARYQKERLARELYEDPTKRNMVEQQLAEDCGISPIDLIIYCPEPDMNLKQAAVKVVWLDGLPRPLNTIADDPTLNEIKELESKHKSLWGLSVFLRADLVDSKGQAVSDACFHRWGLLNEYARFASVGPEPALAALQQMAVEDNLPARIIPRLYAMASRSDEERPRTPGSWRQLMKDVNLGAE